MKKIILGLLLPAIVGGYFSTANAQSNEELKKLKKEKILNWYNTSKTGMSTDKAYKKFLNKMTPDTVVVAIIDSGIDIEHEDLKGNIWINKGEIAGNGIDDDGNGYIDDVHGWNYLGNDKGENQKHARLNATRIYASLMEKYEDVEEEDVACEDKEEYELFLKAKAKVEGDLTQYKAYITQSESLRDNMLPNLPSMIANMMGADTMTEKTLKKWKPKDAQGKQMKMMGEMLLSGDLNEDVINEQIEQLQNMINYHLNPEYDERAEVVGDDYLDMNDSIYGNNDVNGPDATHGTHVGGIVASTRGNELGGDGVADCVKLMSLRAVPDGDEFDKDIALAIRYAVDNGAKVINGSFGKAFSSLQEEVYEAIRYAEENDVLFVHAAGNDAKDLTFNDNFPAVKYDFQDTDFTHLLTIGASTKDHDGNLAAAFSNYGLYDVDIFAPGFEIYNTVPGNKYRKLQGTSMASPMVAGVAALLKGYFPELTMKEIKEIILESGDDFGATMQTKPGTDEKVRFSTLSRTGKVVNVFEAVKLAKERTEK